MKFIFLFSATLLIVMSCNVTTSKTVLPIVGTWELVAATRTEKDSTFSTFNSKVKMIKIINPTHFAFLSHELSGGKDSATSFFSAGGGAYTLKDSSYTEHLQYCNDRQWENHTFEFIISIVNDTLTQTGIEKIESLGVNHIIVEKYKRIE